jgi:hypothetical protein
MKKLGLCAETRGLNSTRLVTPTASTRGLHRESWYTVPGQLPPSIRLCYESLAQYYQRGRLEKVQFTSRTL